jgi:GntR family transcriptional repressor for pyruvate dehydrogenase complex
LYAILLPGGAMIDSEERATLVRSRAAELTVLLRGRIVAGALQPNCRLAPSRQLAEDLGVSRVTLSTAMDALEAEGYLVVRRGKAGGAFISDLRLPATRWALAMRNDAAQLDDIIDHRLAIETRVAALAAQRRTEDDLVRLQQAVKMAGGVRWRVRYRAANWVFHEAVAAASKSTRLQAASRIARGEMWTPSSWLDCEDQLLHVMPSHRAIYEAIRDHHPTKAAVAMMADIESTRAVLQGLVKHETLLGKEIHVALCEAEAQERTQVLEVYADHMHRTLTFRFADD